MRYMHVISMILAGVVCFVQAAFAEIKLQYLDSWNKKNQQIADFYNRELDGIVDVPKLKSYETAVFHNYVIKSEQRDPLAKFLEGKGVQTRIHYPTPIHLQSVAKNLGYVPGDFPNAEKFAKQMLSLPIYPDLNYKNMNLPTKD